MRTQIGPEYRQQLKKEHEEKYKKSPMTTKDRSVEEIVQNRYIKDWRKSLNINERFAWATEEQKEQILAEIIYQREQGGYEALQAERQKREEVVEKVKRETVKEMNDSFVKWLKDNIGNLATEALEKALTQPNNPK